MRVAVVGHTEWAEFARVERVPAAGEIVAASEFWEEAAGGGGVAAVQLARLAGACRFYTALGEDEIGHRAERRFDQLGVETEVDWRPGPQRRAFVHLDASGERTITVTGERLGPRGEEPLGWGLLAEADAVYLTAGDGAAARAARSGRWLVATVRAKQALAEGGVRADLLVASAGDAGESYAPGDIDPPPALVARTEGEGGGAVTAADGTVTRWEPAPLPGPAVDTFGAGDSFAAGVTYGLATGAGIEEALAIGARCGAAVAAGRGPYGRRVDGS